MSKKIVIFENNPMQVKMLEDAIAELNNNSEVLIFPSYERFLKAGIDIREIAAVFLDHHLDDPQVPGDIALTELLKAGFSGHAYSMNNFTTEDQGYYVKRYTQAFESATADGVTAKDNYTMMFKSHWDKIFLKLREEVEKLTPKENREALLGGIK